MIAVFPLHLFMQSKLNFCSLFSVSDQNLVVGITPAAALLGDIFRIDCIQLKKYKIPIQLLREKAKFSLFEL